MLVIGGILCAVGGTGSFACWIMVLIKMFKSQPSPALGIIGIFCYLWAFIWGWMNATKLGLKKMMLMWTSALVISAIGATMIVSAAAKANMEDANIPQMPQIEMTPTE